MVSKPYSDPATTRQEAGTSQRRNKAWERGTVQTSECETLVRLAYVSRNVCVDSIQCITEYQKNE